MMDLGRITFALGLLCSFAALIAGLLFVTSEELAIGVLQCKEGTATDANISTCKNNVVLSATGEECQIARTGILSATYDPACTENTPYELSNVIPKFEGSVLDFPLVFPSQSNLAGIPGAPTFTNCENYFDDSVITIATDETVAKLSQEVSWLKQFGKDIYDAQIANIVPTINATLLGFVEDLLAAFNEEALASSLGEALPTNYDAFYPSGANTTALEVVASLRFGSSSLAELAGLLYEHLEAGIASGDVSKNFLDVARVGSTVGLEPSFVDVGSVFLPDEGSFWVLLNSSTHCGLGVSPCSIITYLRRIANSTLGNTTLQSAIAEIESYESTAGGRSYLESGFATADPAVIPSTRASNIVQTMQDELQASEVEPTDVFSEVSHATALGGIFYATCGRECSFVDFLEASIPFAPSNARKRGFEDALRILKLCHPVLLTPSATCFGAFVQSSPGKAESLKAVLGSLYELKEPETLIRVHSVVAALTESCRVHENERGSLQVAVVAIPLGMGVLGVGILLTIANVLVKAENRETRMNAIATAALSVLGMAIALIGILSLVASPLYSKLGGSGEIEDNSFGFRIGNGNTYLALFATLGFIGSLLLVISSRLLKVKEDPDDNKKVWSENI